ncbi:MAG: ribosome recycling factor [Deltaproteobacteria bacterium]|nr:MAG: ribosome recycling factor [Deltaproteobacteria bacterium]TMB31401.1 MAG: ribosome recycling factor [Deltaproteobacteria bacterium]
MGISDDVLSDLRSRIAKTLDDLRSALAKVRTGRANPQLLDSVRVEYYGTLTPLNQVANVTVADPRLIVIKPWEKSMIAPIEKAINAAGLGINALPDAELVRVPIPALTEERRKEFVKIVKQRGEEHKIAIRNERRDAKELIEEAIKGGELAEDEGKKALERVQQEVDLGVKKVDEVIAGKEKDLMQV